MQGLVSCAEWTGVRLADLLEEAGVDPRAQWLVAEGADAASFSRSVPLAKAMDDALVALYQNGERIRPSNGYPMRLLVPGFDVLFVATSSYLAAVFLVSDARRAGAPDLERYFARRALISALFAGALAAVGLVALHRDARYVFDGLVGDALPLVILSLVCGTGLARPTAPRHPARHTGACGGRSRFCDLGVGRRAASVPAAPALTIDDAAAPSVILNQPAHRLRDRVLVVLPSLGLLYTLVQRTSSGRRRPRRCTTNHAPTPCLADDGPALARRGRTNQRCVG